MVAEAWGGDLRAQVMYHIPDGGGTMVATSQRSPILTAGMRSFSQDEDSEAFG
jgi:hypothetical protein